MGTTNAAAPKLRLRDVKGYLRRAPFRIPFKFGPSTITRAEILHLWAEIGFDDGRPGAGITASPLAPVWFDKDPGRDPAETTRRLLRSVRIAADALAAAGPDTAYGLHRAVYDGVRRACLAEGMNGLTAGFGIALLDSVLVDAVCRRTGRSLHEALAGGLLGWTAPPGILPDRPLSRIFVRHTVGGLDPITAADNPKPVGDGLPETLEEVVRVHGVRYVKAKVFADAGASLDRLRRIAAVLDASGVDYRVTLDGNESFAAMEDAEAFVRRATEDPALKKFWGRVLWLEQPVDRKAALDAGVAGPLARIDAVLPVIIDESGDAPDALPAALALGYRGITAKHCKGIFHSLSNFAWIAEMIRKRPGRYRFSSEDLTNVPVVPLHQDTAVVAALGIPHSERNGHHFLGALDYLPPRERADLLRRFPSAYAALPDGRLVLAVRDGAIAVDEINRFGYGSTSEPDWNSMETVELQR